MLHHRRRVVPSRTTLQTKRLSLSFLELRLRNVQTAAKFADWLNDIDVVRYSEQRHHAHTTATQMQYWLDVGNDPNTVYWFIKIRDTGALIGAISMIVDRINRVGNIGIMIGESTEWGKGYGLEAWSAVTEWADKEAQLARVEAGFMATNNAMRQLCRSAGMKPEGIALKYFENHDGSRVDKVTFGKLL